jgi:hypothetical protein
MREDRRNSSRLAAAFIALGLSLAAGGMAFNLWMLRAQELPSTVGSASSPATAAPVLRLMQTTLIAVAVLATAFIVGSFLIVRIGRFFVGRATGSPPATADSADHDREVEQPAADFRPDSEREEFGPA